MNSGQSPSAGAGIARCLRKAFPHVTLVGVDHWQGSSGLHDPSIDEVLLLPQWKQIDRKRHISQIHEILEGGNLWISALDVEVYWLAQNFGAHPHLICPSGLALRGTAKPSVEALTARLGFHVPESISAFLPEAEVHSFLRQNAWQCWLKGPYHDAKRVTSWEVFVSAREEMQKNWNTTQLFIQKNKIGNEESICFAAYHGELLSAIHMEKRLVTPEGKTWAGRVAPVAPELFKGLTSALHELQWSGGGEIEYTIDPDGVKWIIECNPRFPAWIYGSALVGSNLPGRIVAKVWEMPFLEILSEYPFFTRIVQEVAAKEAVGIPLPLDPSFSPWPTDGQKGKSGPSHASSLPPLRDTMEFQDFNFEDNERDSETVRTPETDSQLYLDEINSLTETFSGETPARVHLEDWTTSRFNSLLEAVRSSNKQSPEIRIGYSIKTCPTDQHLSQARKAGFFLECISQLEVHRALAAGARASDVMLNGPGKFWPLTQPPVTGLHMLFCDSLEEFEQVVEIPNIATCIGFRIRLPKLPSRFGIPVEEYENFEGIIDRIKKINGKATLGFHFHMPSWVIGVKRWKEAFQSIITWCEAVEQLSRVPVKCLDFGGGFFPSDLEGLNFEWIQSTVRKALPRVEGIYFEPGRSLSQDGEILISRVLSVRKSSKKKNVSEVVVDACVAELPLIRSYSHRIFYRAQGNPNSCKRMEAGKVKVLGRICMESDVLHSGIRLPENVKIGDLIVFGDAGAYERTMSYVFGRG